QLLGVGLGGIPHGLGAVAQFLDGLADVVEVLLPLGGGDIVILPLLDGLLMQLDHLGVGLVQMLQQHRGGVDLLTGTGVRIGGVWGFSRILDLAGGGFLQFGGVGGIWGVFQLSCLLGVVELLHHLLRRCPCGVV